MGRNSIIQFGTPPARDYDGILMRANPTLHEEAFALLRRAAPTGAKVIDVGSGQGAFAARLRDQGYSVTSVDKNPEDFRALEVDFIAVNFDVADEVARFKAQHGGRYDVAIGMEVIEHVENPWEYVRFLLALVHPGGTILLTTPNAGSVQSRVEFLFSGLFTHFSRADHVGSGHINPLTMHELMLIVEGTGAEIVEARTICRVPWLVVSRRPLLLLRSVIGAMLRPFMGRQASGDIICLVLRKPA